MRVAVGGFMHETNTFAPSRATFEMFERPDSWPGLSVGPAVLEVTKGINIPIAGFAAAAGAFKFDLAPTLWCNAGPSAHVTDDAFDRITGDLIKRLRAAGPVDAVYLDLHGAMVTESREDGEGAVLAMARAAVGPDVPIVASLDLHANVTTQMFENADALVGFRTYPHVDMAITGRRTAALLNQILQRGRPKKAMRRTDFLVSINWQCTLAEPAKTIYERLETLEAAGDVASLSFLQGFPPADIAECGPSVVAYGWTQASADAAADALLGDIIGRQAEFDGPYHTPDEAVAAAHAISGGDGPVVIADTQDNPGGGGDGDTTGLLRALVSAAPEGAVLGLLVDPEAAAAAHAAGIGGRFHVQLGGRSWPEDSPLAIDLTVERLGDGAFLCTGPFYAGANMQLGPMALVRAGDTPVRIVLASRKAQAADQEMFRHVGIEPRDMRILGLKSSVHFRADFGPLAAEILIARAPGPVIADPADLPYQRLRNGVRLGPSGPIYTRGDAASERE